jgi:hypothetical protein
MKVFLSHASVAKPLVRRIGSVFPSHVEVWLDQDEMGPGAIFPVRLERAIREDCDYVLVFVDAAALGSDWVRREVEIALQREIDLKRDFLLPVLLEDVSDRLDRLGDLQNRLYLTAYDHADEALQRCGRQLCEQLFALASRLVETLRTEGRRELLRQFDADVTGYKQAAFMWLATLRNSLAVLSTNQAAFDHVKEAVSEYNRVSDAFIPRLSHWRDRIGAAWSAHRGLTQSLRALVASIENDVYRGAMFRLNEVLGMMHALDAAGGPTDEPMATLDARKDAVLAQADAALHAMAARSTALVTELESEI